jgi:hypothetical protein
MESSRRKELFMASGKRRWLFLTIILSAFVVLGGIEKLQETLSLSGYSADKGEWG